MQSSICQTIPAGGVFAALLLTPAVALACGAGKGDILAGLLLTAGMTVLTIYLVTALVAAASSWLLEKCRGIKLNKPSLWKMRIWAVGVVGFVFAFALGLFIDNYFGALTIDYHLLGDILFVFVLTFPFVLQCAYVAFSWHKRGWTS